MSGPSVADFDSIYRRKVTSPDGRWRVVDDYVDGERSPLITSPRVVEIASGRIVLDLWRSSLNGDVSDFTPQGFRVTISDPYAPIVVIAEVDAATETFVISGKNTAPRPLSDLSGAAREIVDKVHEEARERAAQAARAAIPPKPTTWWGWVKYWCWDD